MSKITSHEQAIQTEGLSKAFGQLRAVDDLTLQVPAGTVFGVLGPNGAGKSTTIRMLATLTRPDGGFARVLGCDVVDEADEVRRRTSLTGQFASLDVDLTAEENLTLIARLRGHGRRYAATRTEELLTTFGLDGSVAGRQVRTYSGGMRRRLDIAAGMVDIPELLFLDEPTTGLDPRSRSEVWHIVRELAAASTTVLLTTQYLDEADQLADRVGVIDRGSLVAEGTTADLKAKVGAGVLRLRVAGPEDRARAQSILHDALAMPVTPDATPVGLSVSVPSGTRSTEIIHAALLRLADNGVHVSDFSWSQPSLDEVFLTLTGHHANSGEGDAA